MSAGEFLDVDEKKLELILEDSALRDELGIGAGTGPKGVKSDYKFHQKQEHQRETQKTDAYLSSISNKALKSGWLNREIERENKERNPMNDRDQEQEDKDEKETDDLIRELEDEMEDHPENHESIIEKSMRLDRIRTHQLRHQYGTLITATASSFIQLIENNQLETVVFVHVVNQRSSACRIVNELLANIAKKYPGSKFVQVDRDEIEASFDEAVLPVLLCYRGGELVESLIRFTQDLGTWKLNMKCEPQDLEDLLIKKGLLNENDIVDYAY